jgi:hypothetical protein
VLNNASQVGGVEVYNDSPAASEYEVRLPGLDFDTPGEWFSKTGSDFDNDPSLVTNPVLRGQRTLFDMLTRGGTDRSGLSSEVYLILFGDDADAENNGAFKVIGAGSTAGYTDKAASAADRVRVIALQGGWSSFASPGAAALAGELRSQTTNSEDGTGFASSLAAASITITEPDIDRWGTLILPQDSKMALNLTLQYHPGRSGMARVPGDIWRVAAVNTGGEFLRQSKAAIDGDFPGLAGTPSNETEFPATHVMTWNRLAGQGDVAPNLTETGGGSVVLSSEQDRETECFFDAGSKTLIFRPFLNRAMTLHTQNILSGSKMVGPDAYPGPTPPAATPKDGADIFTTGLTMAYEVPAEYMPRFGRQDIPYYQDDLGNPGSGTFLDGINHLFTDTTDPTDPQFAIIGGQDNTSGGNDVSSLFLQTGSTSGLDYCEYGTITGTLTPGYQGRLMSDDTIASSDLGRGLRGIELPPYLGIARLYGVYDRRDFVDKGDAKGGHGDEPASSGCRQADLVHPSEWCGGHHRGRWRPHLHHP